MLDPHPQQRLEGLPEAYRRDGRGHADGRGSGSLVSRQSIQPRYPPAAIRREYAAEMRKEEGPVVGVAVAAAVASVFLGCCLIASLLFDEGAGLGWAGPLPLSRFSHVAVGRSCLLACLLPPLAAAPSSMVLLFPRRRCLRP